MDRPRPGSNGDVPKVSCDRHPEGGDPTERPGGAFGRLAPPGSVQGMSEVAVGGAVLAIYMCVAALTTVLTRFVVEGVC